MPVPISDHWKSWSMKGFTYQVGKMAGIFEDGELIQFQRIWREGPHTSYEGEQEKGSIGEVLLGLPIKGYCPKIA